MQLGQRGESLIKSYEKLRLTAFKPTIDDPWTIGWGHTRNVKEGATCTPEQAELWFKEDVEETFSAFPRHWQLTQSMFDALVSLTYNVGVRAISTGPKGSTIGSALDKNDHFAACRGFFLWIMESGAPSLGLARRRAREMGLFLEDGLPITTHR